MRSGFHYLELDAAPLVDDADHGDLRPLARGMQGETVMNGTNVADPSSRR